MFRFLKGRLVPACCGWRRLTGALLLVLVAAPVIDGGDGGETALGAVHALIISPAHADRDRDRARRLATRNRDRKDAERNLNQLQQAAAAQKSAQEAEAAQRRLQQLQEAAAAQQRRLQQLQQLEAAQRSAQQAQRQAAEAAQRRVIQMQNIARPSRPDEGRTPSLPQQQDRAATPQQQHRAALQDTMRRIRERHPEARVGDGLREQAQRQIAATQKHQAALQNALAKLRPTSRSEHRAGGGMGRDIRPPQFQTRDARAHAVLQRTMDKLRHRVGRNDHDRDRGGFGQRPQMGDRFQGSRHLARYRDIHDRLSRRDHRDHRDHRDYRNAREHRDNDHGGRWGRKGRSHDRHSDDKDDKQEVKNEVAVANSDTSNKPPAAATPPANTSNKTPNNKSGGTLFQQVPDVTNVASPIITKLPSFGSTSKQSDRNSDSEMSRLGGPDDPNGEDGRGRERSAKKNESDRDDGDAASQSGSRPRLGSRGSGPLLPPPGTFRPNEILAINVKQEALDTALKLSFRAIDTIQLPGLNLTITRLATPDVQNALVGRTMLHEVLPNEGFGLNHIYTTGKTPPASLVPAGTDSPPGSKAAGVPERAAVGPGTRPGPGCSSERCFGMSAINWQPQLASCAQGVRIGVIDTGLDSTHPAFAGARFEHKDFTPRNAKKPSNQHGTGIFSLLAGNPKSSTPGLVPNATFLVGDAFFADQSGHAVSDTLTMLKALNWLKTSRVDVANLSFAGPRDELVEDAIRALAKAGTVIVAAAGNEGPDAPPSYPAAYPEVIAVTAVDRKLAPYVYANRGEHIAVAAPGVDVWTALPNRREGPQTGTSFAVPFVTSVVALSYRADLAAANDDPLDPKQRALALIKGSVKPLAGRREVFGAGLVQAPSHCEPRGPSSVASVQHEAVGAWGGTMRATSAAAIQPQGGSWTGVVRRGNK